MKSNTKNIYLKILIALFIVILLFGGLFFAFDKGLFMHMASSSLKVDTLDVLNKPIEIYDSDYNLIENNVYIKELTKIDDLPHYIPEAFISIEDKDFYKHKGLSYKGMLRALFTNLKSGAYKQGASTISQQLIKNTHLSNKKTISRKINEILLTQQLESQFDKKEILQAYLNAIYFGKGTFGIEKASQKYFGKSAKNLSLEESATLAAIIKSPKAYSPIENYEKCKQRRNLVLDKMYQNNYISKEQCDKSKQMPIALNIKNTDLGENTYYNRCIKEACEILNITEKDLFINEYKIYSNQNVSMQNTINMILDNNTTADQLMCVIDNATGKVLAYQGKSNFNLANRNMQPGSIIKPLVYSAALDKKIIMTSSKILDEPINISGYTPKNFDNKYHGWVSVKESLAKSYNIPAVKILQYVTIPEAKKHINKFGISLNKDNGYSIALGGLSDGVDFISMANSYTTFANKGRISNPTFINQIKNKYGRTIYTAPKSTRQIITEDNAYLMTDMLKESVNSGTAKKLKAYSNNNVASKTGTAGNKKGNTDIWNISYTPTYTIAAWQGAKSNSILPSNVVGSGEPTIMVGKMLAKINNNINFVIPKTIQTKYVSIIDLEENNKIKLADISIPARYKRQELFSSSNLPEEWSTKLDKLPTTTLKASFEDKKLKLTFDAKKYINYEIYKKEKGCDQLVGKVSDHEGKYDLFLEEYVLDRPVSFYIKYYLSGENSQKYEFSKPVDIYTFDNKKWE